MENSLETKKNAIGLMPWQHNPTPSPLSNFLELSPIAREVKEEAGEGPLKEQVDISGCTCTGY